MYRLTDIVLSNWYLIRREQIRIRGAAALVGPTGAGKSTIFDAVGTVLAGNNASRLALNASASGRSARTVRDYCLGWISKHPRPISGKAPSGNLLQPPAPPLAMLPRDAALARKEVVPLESAAGRTAAEMVMFYPPGIPLLMPGELITEETLDVCRQLHAAGGHLYASDHTLQTVRVVAD